MRPSPQSMINSSARRFAAPTGRPVPAAHPLKAGSAPGYGQGGYQAPGPQKSGGSKLPLIALLVALGGAGAYYATLDDPKAAAANDARKLERGVKNEIDEFRAGPRTSSAPLVDASASRRELERAKDAATPSRSWSDSLGLGSRSTADEAASKVQGVVEDVKDTAASWGRSLKGEVKDAWHGHGEGVKNEIVRWKQALSSPDGKMGVEQVEEYLRSKGHYTTTLESYPLFDFFGTGSGLRKSQAEISLGRYEREGENFINSAVNRASAQYESAKGSVKNAGRDAQSAAHDAKNETKSWFSWGEKKTAREYENAKSDVKDTYYSAKADAKDTYYNAKSEAKDTYYNVKSEAKDAANSVSRSFENAADDVDRTTRDAVGKLAAPLQRGAQRVEESAQEAANSARSAYYDASNAAGRALDSAKGTAENVADDASRAANRAEAKVKSESKSWLSWSEQKAEDGKNTVKDGLLAAERGVEKGAQEAQYQTKKL
ncbi:Zeo1p [Sporobolomyces koalae]|uniref:Zeo1p n=1 Tax=Sporobolomyces koalae TaxID=500713 RepID=UPI003171A3DB